MLSDIPYRNIMDTGRMYDVWVLRDVYGNTFSDIAREYGVSAGIIIENYNKLLWLKIKYYVNHLSIVHGHENTAYFRKIWHSAYECYAGRNYVAAYFEKEYAAVLSEYRDGEPGMPLQLLQALPPFRNEFSKHTVSSVVRLRETNGMTYAAIGKRLRMTKEKAEDLYIHYYHALYYELSEKIMEITGDKKLRDKYNDAFSVRYAKKKYECLVRDYPELCEKLLKSNH